MAQEKNRFAFDDEEEIVENEDIEETLPKEDSFVVEDSILPISDENTSMEIDELHGDETMNKKKKRKFKLRVWHVLLLIFVLVVGGFLTYIFMATNNDGPVYGDRCAVLLAIDDNKFEEVEAQMVAVDGIQSLDISKDCRIIEIVITYDAGVDADMAQGLALQTLQTLDIALGYEKENPEDPYSKVFGEANGRGQYNVDFRLRTAGEDANFPIFGTKQPKSNDVSFTRASPASQETTDQVKGNTTQE